MFFQPKFYRGSKAPPPSAPTPDRGRAESLPFSDHRHYAPSVSSTGRQATVDTAASRPDGRRQWTGGDYSLKDAHDNAAIARTEYFPPQYHSPNLPPKTGKIDFSCPSPLPPLPPFSPLSPLARASISPSTTQSPRTPATHQPYHSTTPSLSSDKSQSSGSSHSFGSEALLTPVRSYLHPPPSPSLSIAPSRPLPPTPVVPSSRPRPSQSRSPSPWSKPPRSLRGTPPPPDAGLYASMPLPPLPSADPHSRSPTPSSLRSTSSPALPRPDFHPSKRNNRDSQATVRPTDSWRYRDAQTRDPRPVLPLPSILFENSSDKDSHIQIRTNVTSELFEFDDEADAEASIPDFNLLSIFPMPPSRSCDSLARPSEPSLRRVGREGSEGSILRAKRLSSRSTIRLPSRKAPPPPLPQLKLDLFSVDVGDGMSEADRIREQYLVCPAPLPLAEMGA